MNLRLERLAGATIVSLDGRLDFAAANAFQQELEHALAGAAPLLLVDCAQLDYVSSAGLRGFLLAARAAQRGGFAFALCALTPPVREVLDLSGFSRILTIYPDRSAALAQGAAPPT